MAIKNILILDYESYYDREECTLKKLSPPEYIFHKKFAVHLLAAYDLSWDAPRIIEARDIPAFLQQYPAEETMSVSHSALFDGAISAWKYGWVPARMQDTLGMARSLRNLSRYSLGAVAEGLFGFDPKGTVIHKVAGMNIQQIKNAGLWPEYKTYAMQDARTCAQIFLKLYPEFPVEEQLVMDLVLRTAIVPTLHADVRLLETHLAALRRHKTQLLHACGYDKAALMSTVQFQLALENLGVVIETKPGARGPIPAFAKSDQFMTDLLEYDQSDDEEVNHQVQTLAMARLSHKSTIEETRAQRFLNIARLPWGNGAMLPVALRYGGAHTHRLSGEWGMNMQNLPRDAAKSKLRASLIPPSGHKIIAADLSQIEARIVAQLAGQTSLITQFRNGEDVYANFGTRLFMMRVDKKDTPHHRWIAKTAVLGLGYGCGWERFYKMVIAAARQHAIPIDGIFSEATAQRTVNTYRTLFSAIPQLWYTLDRLKPIVVPKGGQNIRWSKSEIHKQGDVSTYSGVVRQEVEEEGKIISSEEGHLVVDTDTNKVWCATRRTTAPPGLNAHWRPLSLQLGPMKIERGRIALPNGMFLRYKDVKYDSVWGATLLENCSQALARIVIMQAALRLAKRGYRFVLQAHDELVFCVPDDQVEEAKQTILDEMIKTPDWLPGLPLAAEIGVGDNYAVTK